MLDERAAGHGMASGLHAAAAGMPALEPSAAGDRPVPRGAEARDSFHHLIQADAHDDAHEVALDLVRRALAQAARQSATTPEGCGSIDWRTATQSWHADVRARPFWQATLERQPPHRRALWLLPLAPELLADGCWLQHACSALNSHLPVTSPLVRSYVARGSRAKSFARRLRASDMVLPPLVSDAFAREPEIDTAMYALPAFGMALSWFPTLLLPEILGFNLAMAQAGRHPLLDLLDAGDKGSEDRLPAEAIEALEAVEDLPSARVTSGWQVAQTLHAQRNRSLEQMARSGWFGPAARMARLVQRKAAVAMGYHARVRSGEGSLDERFEQAHANPGILLQWLARSPYVLPGAPERSRLVASIASPRGSMAGVLGPQEVDIVRDWIRQLPDGVVAPRDEPDVVLDDSADEGPPEGLASVSLPPPVRRPDERLGDLPLRQFYFRLLHLESHPELRPQAYRFAQLWLARSGLGLEKGEQPLPFTPFSHRSFGDWLVARHAAQLQGHAEASGAPPPSREELIASCVQLCPMVYIDGAWLQRMGQVGFRGSAVAEKLQAIYLDEVGAGDVRENHPNLYRELMAAMGVEMPPFGTEAFAHWPGFDDASFRLPVMWLCLSQFPRQFMPELLGFNLAIELSGVGGSYRTSSDALRRHGYPSTFVDVHNTIDNITSGHTALAFDAIRLHLDEAMDHGGPDEVQRRWKRVWTGWRAIVPPAGMVWN